jgi:hypothetical protein
MGRGIDKLISGTTNTEERKTLAVDLLSNTFYNNLIA